MPDNNEIKIEIPEYRLVGDSLAETVTDDASAINALTWGTYNSGRQYVLGYKQNMENRFNHNNVASLGVDFTLHFGDAGNITKINDNWRTTNSIYDKNFYDFDFNNGNTFELLEYAKSFSQGKLDYYSLYNSDLNALRNVSDIDQSIYNAFMSGNLNNFKTDKNKDLITDAQKLINGVCEYITDFDRKYYNGEKRVIPIRIALDEINEGYYNKYAKSNFARYGIKYVPGSKMVKDTSENTINKSEDELTEFINRYRNEYDLASSDGVGWVFVPIGRKQFIPLLMAQFADCRAHDYTNQTDIEQSVDHRYDIETPSDIYGAEEEHRTYSLLRNVGLFYPEFAFDGITNGSPGSNFGRTQSAVGTGAIVGGSTVGAVGGTIGSFIGSVVPGGTLPGMAAGEALGWAIGAPVGAVSGMVGQKIVDSGQFFNNPGFMSDMIDLGNKIYRSIKNVENKQLNENDHEDVSTTGSTMSALSQDRLESLVRSGELTVSVAKDILSNQVDLINNIKNIPITDYNYKVYMEDSTGDFLPAIPEAKKVVQDVLKLIKPNQLNLRVIHTGSSYEDGSTAYYEFSLPNSMLLEQSLGTVEYERLLKSIKDPQKTAHTTSFYLKESPVMPIDFSQDESSINKAFNINSVTSFRIPVNIIDSPDTGFYTDPLVLNANELTHFGNQYARMQLLKDSFFGDVAILSDKVNGAKGTALRHYQFDFDGKYNLKNKEIQDVFTTRIYNDYAEIEQLMKATREYMPYEEILRYYMTTYKDDWRAHIHPKYVDGFIDKYAEVYNKLADLTEVKDYAKEADMRDNVFGDSALSRFLETARSIDQDIYDEVLRQVKVKPTNK